MNRKYDKMSYNELTWTMHDNWWWLVADSIALVAIICFLLGLWP